MAAGRVLCCAEAFALPREPWPAWGRSLRMQERSLSGANYLPRLAAGSWQPHSSPGAPPSATSPTGQPPAVHTVGSPTGCSVVHEAGSAAP